MANQQKKEYVSKLVSKLDSAPHFVVFELTATTHQQLEDFRAQLRELNDDITERPVFSILKNSLFKVAFDTYNRKAKTISSDEGDKLKDEVSGQTALMVLPSDWIGGLKVFKKFSKDLDGTAFKVGIIDGEVYFEDGLQKLADLPSRDQLIARLIGSFKAPHSRLVYGMQFNATKLVNVLKNAAKEAN